MRRLLVALGLLALGAGGRAFATSDAALNIDVTIQGSLSVQVDGTASSTYTAVWNATIPNQKLISASTATVTNNSGALTEKWALSTNAASIDQGTGGGWTLAASSTSVGADAFAVQAVFGSSNTAAGGCPAAGAADWNAASAAPLTAAPQTYTSTLFSDAALNSGNGSPFPDIANGTPDGRMRAGSQRALCWRLVMPATTSTVDTQNVQIIVTAQAP